MDGHSFKRYRLQDRDKHLLAMLGMCRYLTTDQIRRLCYAGRTETPAEKRLRQLGGIGKFGFPQPFVERRMHRTWDGTLVCTWKLTRRGYLAGSALVPSLRMPSAQSEIADAFLEHTLALNNLFVSLAEAPLLKTALNRKGGVPRRRLRNAAEGLYANAKELPFRWTPSESSRLPWHEHRDGKKHVIVPDAILTLPSLRLRVFLECEMGTHSIVARNGDKPGATVAKVERYHDYFCRLAGGAGATWYAEQFEDGFTPEVLYLVHSKARAEHVNAAIDDFESRTLETSPRQVAKTWADASKALLTELGQWGPELETPRNPDRPGPRVLTAFEVKSVRHYYRQATDTIRRQQHLAEQRGEPPPSQPNNKPFIMALLDNLERSLQPPANL